MKTQTKTIAEINAKLQRGEAVVMTAMEFKKEVRSGSRIQVADVDVVTTATRGLMSGTSATVVLPSAGEDGGRPVRGIWLNGVPCTPAAGPADGPAAIEALIYGTAESVDCPGRYGGGHLLKDIVAGQEIHAEFLTDGGRRTTRRFTIADLGFARIYSFRNAFQNYHAFANIKNLASYRENRRSIFSCRPMPLLRGLSCAGSGELNPLENDPSSRVMRAGMKILVNKAPGVVIGYGTRSSPQMRNLSLAADMRGMDPEFMGGFITGGGVEVINSVAVPFPILNQGVLDDLSRCLDENIPLHLADIGDRLHIADVNYADVWAGARLEIEFDPDRCICCSFTCAAEYYCPMQAISWRDKTIDAKLCYGCGACTSNCPGGAFMGKGDIPRGCVGSIHALGTEIPILFRQSNRHRAQLLAEYLKEIMLKGDFLLNDSDLKMEHRHV